MIVQNVNQSMVTVSLTVEDCVEMARICRHAVDGSYANDERLRTMNAEITLSLFEALAAVCSYSGHVSSDTEQGMGVELAELGLTEGVSLGRARPCAGDTSGAVA